MVFKLVRTDSVGPNKILLPVGTHLIGRGKFLDCEDKRISRNHGNLIINEDSVVIESLHQNPCFWTKKGTTEIQILKKSFKETLQNGDRFGLLPGSFWYEVVHVSDPDSQATDVSYTQEDNISETNKVNNDNLNDNDEKCHPNDETVQDNEVSADPNDTGKNEDSEYLDFDLNETLDDADRPESPSVLDKETQLQPTNPPTTESQPDLDTAQSTDQPDEPVLNTVKTEPKSPSPKRSHSTDSSEEVAKKIKTEPDEVKQDALKQDPDSTPGPSNDQAAASQPDDGSKAPAPAPAPRRERCMYAEACYRERRRVSYSQLEILYGFLRGNRDLATGYNKNARAREAMRRMWQTIAQTLNAQDGAVKDWKTWSKYWNDYKCKLKKAFGKVTASNTEGGPSDTTYLTEIERKFLEVLRGSSREGLPGTRKDSSDLDGQENSEICLDRWCPLPEAPRDFDLSGSSRDTPLGEPSRDAALGGPSGDFDLAGPSRDASLSGPSRDAALGGPSREAALTGPSRDAALGGPSRDAALAGPSRDLDLAGPSRGAGGSRIRTPRQRARRRPPMSQDAARRILIEISKQRAATEAARNDILRELLNDLKDIKEILRTRLPSPGLADTPELFESPQDTDKNPQHLAQYSHPRDADWGGAGRAPCPWGAACRRRDPRHQRLHDHPPGARPPPPAKKPRRKASESGSEDEASTDLIVVGKRKRNPLPNLNGSDSEADPYASDGSDEWQPPSDYTQSQD